MALFSKPFSFRRSLLAAAATLCLWDGVSATTRFGRLEVVPADNGADQRQRWENGILPDIPSPSFSRLVPGRLSPSAFSENSDLLHSEDSTWYSSGADGEEDTGSAGMLSVSLPSLPAPPSQPPRAPNGVDADILDAFARMGRASPSGQSGSRSQAGESHAAPGAPGDGETPGEGNGVVETPGEDEHAPADEEQGEPSFRSSNQPTPDGESSRAGSMGSESGGEVSFLSEASAAGEERGAGTRGREPGRANVTPGMDPSVAQPYEAAPSSPSHSVCLSDVRIPGPRASDFAREGLGKPSRDRIKAAGRTPYEELSRPKPIPKIRRGASLNDRNNDFGRELNSVLHRNEMHNPDARMKRNVMYDPLLAVAKRKAAAKSGGQPKPIKKSRRSSENSFFDRLCYVDLDNSPKSARRGPHDDGMREQTPDLQPDSNSDSPSEGRSKVKGLPPLLSDGMQMPTKDNSAVGSGMRSPVQRSSKPKSKQRTGLPAPRFHGIGQPPLPPAQPASVRSRATERRWSAPNSPHLPPRSPTLDDSPRSRPPSPPQASLTADDSPRSTSRTETDSTSDFASDTESSDLGHPGLTLKMWLPGSRVHRENEFKSRK